MFAGNLRRNSGKIGQIGGAHYNTRHKWRFITGVWATYVDRKSHRDGGDTSPTRILPSLCRRLFRFHGSMYPTARSAFGAFDCVVHLYSSQLSEPFSVYVAMF